MTEILQSSQLLAAQSVDRDRGYQPVLQGVCTQSDRGGMLISFPHAASALGRWANAPCQLINAHSLQEIMRSHGAKKSTAHQG